MQALTARLGAMNLNSNDLSSISHALGLSSQQISQIQQTIQASRQPAAPGVTPPQLYSQQQPSALAGPGALSGAGCMPTPLTGPPSLIESKFQQLDNPFVAASTPSTSNLTQFGYSSFTSQVSTFAPTQNVPVSDDYVLGPGDELIVFTWGRVNSQLLLQVQKDGSVLIDQVGPLQVAGLTFGQARKLIEGRLKQSAGTEVNLTMGQLRTIQVTVVGEVNQPGTYTISALSRVSNALVAAGGPAKTASLRRIELRRSNQLVSVLDLYDILLNGQNGADVQLQQGDVIRVPVIGNVVAVAGDVKRPAIFELSDQTEQLQSVVQHLAGGLSAFAYNGRLQVERIQNHQQMVVLDIPIRKLERRSFQIGDGDLVKVLSVLPYHNATVILSGNVFRPGEYQWRRAMRVADLIREGQGVLPHTYFKYALIKRIEGPQRYTHFVQVDLAAALSGSSLANINLQNHDELDIYSLDQLRDMPLVTVTGEVRIPGQYLLSERMRVSDLIYLSGGLKEDAYWPRAELARVSVQNGHATHRTFDLNLRDIISGPPNYDLILQADDQLLISSVLDYQSPPRSVIVNGEVQKPGLYDFNDGMRIHDLIGAAGGFKDDADKRKVEIARTEVGDGISARRTFVELDLRPGSPELSYPLTFNDEVFVTIAPNWHLPWVVTVSGRVSKPGQYPIHGDERLSSLISRCGGFLPDAYPKALVFTRASVQQMEQKDLDDARQRISGELAQYSIQSAGLSSAPGGSAASGALQGTIAFLQQLLMTTQGQQADGRIVLRTEDMMRGGQASQDIVLQDGDSIAVPRMVPSVSVLGQVYHPAAIVVRHHMTVAGYLAEAGGVTPQGDVRQIMVIKADGAVMTRDGFKESGASLAFPLLPLISSGLMSQTLEPGDTIYVPESLADIQTAIRMKYWTDVTTIVSNSATGLAVLGLLATKL
jgi:polysaccharide export outer membrane protein